MSDPIKAVVEFEKQVMVMARQLYPGKSCFSARELNPIREKLKGAQEAMKVAPILKPEPILAVSAQSAPTAIPDASKSKDEEPKKKRKYRKRRK